MKQVGGFRTTRKIVTALVDVLLFFVSFYISFFVRYGRTFPVENFQSFTQSFWYIILFFLALNILSGVYVYYNKSVGDLLFITIIDQFFLSLFIMVLTFAGRWLAFPRSVILLNLIFSIILLFLWRYAVFEFYRRFSGSKKIMVIGKQEKVFAAIDNFKSSKSVRHIVTHVALDRYLENVQEYLKDVDIVYIASQINQDERIEICEYVMRNNKKVFLNTSFDNLLLVNPNLMNIEDESIMELSGFEIPQEIEMMKRIADILISLVLLVITSPIMLVAAILVKRSSEGPIFYRQTRVTKGGLDFEILKFRSMGVTAEQESGPVLATSNDVRVTPVGKYLRALRIDELPQLINVLKGDMSLVGPRPERPFFVEQFKEENPYYYLRHNVRAGITGYAQVYGKYASNFNSKLNFDLIYIKKYSLVLDIKIMLQTVKILFDKVSSQGLEEGEQHIYTERELEESGISVLR
ncbi:sugar transferase [Granulicatella seriolae]|uniref:Sugar transferase n=1 Tax=Granulicatella seriolae TaxID=2967226 RepID=A0ABT1WQ77_9LACT|nr:sugar transferase [Granulicatella seriolae]